MALNDNPIPEEPDMTASPEPRTPENDPRIRSRKRFDDLLELIDETLAS